MASAVRWGILSTARIGRALLKGIGLSKTSCVQAVASRDHTRAGEWAKEHGIPRAFGSYEDLIDSGEVDALYNPLPNSMHAEWTIRALEAGLPVLCEKPLTTNAAEAREVARAADRTGIPVAEAFMYRFHPLYDSVSDAIARGDIGDVVMIRSAFSFNLPDRTNIRWSRDLAGGALMDVGCYCVNLSRRFAGCEPCRVQAMERRDGVDGTILGLLEFPNGVMASFETSMERQSRGFAEIEGTDGLIALDSPWFPGEEQAGYTLRRGDDVQTISVPGANTYQLEVDDFVSAVRTQSDPRWTLDDAVANMAVIDALYRAAHEGLVTEVESV
ncbi:MAG: Gfo/Idh/MocA family oxidoreductase [bacterium]|nr:Gfo/Idh/MocA family oxidoreductase [bacterium]